MYFLLFDFIIFSSIWIITFSSNNLYKHSGPIVSENKHKSII